MKKTAIFLTVLYSLTACSERQAIPDSGDKDGRIILSASVETTSSKAAVGDGTVEEGSYVFSYYSTPDAVSLCQTVFSAGQGFPMVESSDGIYTYLRWRDVSARQSDGKFRFTLDNVAEYSSAGSVTLGERYAAAPQSETDAPDIVWGSAEAEEGKEPDALQFTLTHRMSMVSVEIYMNTDDVALDGADAEVSLSNVYTVPESFDRETGLVSVSGQRENLILHKGVLEQSGNRYVVDPWLLPPQTFDEDNWPVLSLTVGGKTYSGTLTHYMVDDGGDIDTPSEMNGFEASRHLTIRARISDSSEDIPLIFMPVLVKKWEETADAGIIAKQQGIYTVTDYAEAVEAYNAEPEDAQSLIKYASFDENTGRWTFYIFRDIGSAETVSEMKKFKDGDFDMEFHGYTVYGFGEDEKDALVMQPEGVEGI